jgi:hypothetical protein
MVEKQVRHKVVLICILCYSVLTLSLIETRFFDELKKFRSRHNPFLTNESSSNFPSFDISDYVDDPRDSRS